MTIVATLTYLPGENDPLGASYTLAWNAAEQGWQYVDHALEIAVRRRVRKPEMESSCANCKWYLDPASFESTDSHGRCRVLPPQNQNSYSGGVTAAAMPYTLPIVPSDFRCGHWKADAPSDFDSVAMALARTVLDGDLNAARPLVDKCIELLADAT